MIAHERALEWQELFDLAAREGISEEDVVDMGYRLAGALTVDRWDWQRFKLVVQRICLLRSDTKMLLKYIWTIVKMSEKL